MNHNLFLKISLPVIALPALVVLFLPAKAMAAYVDFVEPVALLIGAFLALWVSFSYRKQLKAAFVFLSIFLLIYAIAVVSFLSYSPLLLPFLETRLGPMELPSIVEATQFINYAMLLFFCINILKVVDIRKLNKNGWLLFAFTLVYAVIAAVYPMFNASSIAGELSVPNLIIRILDALLIVILVPVVWLYIQHLASQQRQSLTFTIVIFGIVLSTIFDYLFQLIMAIFPGLLGADSKFYIAIPEMLFIYGYLMIAVGLYALRKEDEWGYKAIDKALSGELKLVDEE